MARRGHNEAGKRVRGRRHQNLACEMFDSSAKRKERLVSDVPATHVRRATIPSPSPVAYWKQEEQCPVTAAGERKSRVVTGATVRIQGSAH